VPPLPLGAVQFTPPAVYRVWWDLTQACSGLSGDFPRVTWYRVPDAETIPLGRLGKSNELGAAICFLCSDGAGFITGHVLPHAGGWA